MKNWRYWRNLFLFGFSTLALSLTIAVLHLTYQHALGYVHPGRMVRLADDTPTRYGIPYQEITLKTSDGLTLYAWYTPPQNGAVVLVVHGYTTARSADIHSLFARHRYGVVSLDLRAHGESEGELCTFGYYERLDVEAALDFALSQPGVERVGAWGGSMGGATVILTAARRPEIEAVVTDSTYATLEDELDIMVHSALLRPLVRFFAEQEAGISIHDVRPVDAIGQISPRPVLIIQGLADTTVPPTAGERLFQAAGEPKSLWVEPGVGHLAMRHTFPEEYERRIITFCDEARLAGEQNE